jgi:hypothetical protein
MKDQSTALIDRYLFGELTADELERFESDLATQEDVFYSTLERENELVDQYVRGGLDQDLLTRFESSLTTHSSRKEKIATAAALAEHIGEASPARTTFAEPGFFERLTAVFRSPAYAFGGLALILLAACLFLVYENRQATAELARLRTLDTNTKVNVPNDMQSQIDYERAVAGDLSVELETEQSRAERLERELRELRTRLNEPVPSPSSKPPPSIRTVTLRPDRTAGEIDIVSATDTSPRRTSVVIALPKDVTVERVSITVNGREVADGLLVRTDAAGNKSVSVTIKDSELKPGDNPISVLDGSGHLFVVYVLRVSAEN